MKFGKLRAGGLAILALLVTTMALSCARQAAQEQDDHAKHDHSKHSATAHNPAMPTAHSYADAIKQIQARMVSLAAIVKSGKYDDVHNDSVAIEKLCDLLTKFAAAQDSPVAKDKVQEVSDTAKQLSTTSRSFHKAAHADDLEQLNADYARMGKFVESLARHAPMSGGDELPKVPSPDAAAAKVAQGYRVEVVVSGLTYPTSVDFDDAGNMYVAEGGYAYGDPVAAARVWRVSPKGQMAIATERLSAPVNDLLWHDGRLYISHRGRVSQLQGEEVHDLIAGLPSDGDHHNNQLTVGPEGKIYFGQGTVTNSGVVGMDNFEFGRLKKFPDLHDVPAREIRLVLQDFQTPNVLDLKKVEAARTSAFHAFGKTANGEGTVPGSARATGTVLRMNPDGSNLEAYAWGLRNPYGVMWGPDKRLYVSNNSYDERGSRPIANAPEEVFIVKQGSWCGWPDFAAGIPVTDARYKSDRGPSPQFLMREHPPLEKPWLTFPKHSAVTKIDFSRGKGFGHEGQMFMALFGHMTPVTGTIEKEGGHRVVRIDPATGAVETFFGGVDHEGGHQQAGGHSHGGNGHDTKKGAPGHDHSQHPGDAQQGEKSAGHAGGQQHGAGHDKMLHDVSPGPRRLVDVRFSPDGDALYVVDFGVMVVSEKGPRPVPETGVIWRITREGTKVTSPPAGLLIAPGSGMPAPSPGGQGAGHHH